MYDLLKYKNTILTLHLLKKLENRILNEKINQMDSIIQPIITEKATVLSEFNKTVFKVHKGANKLNIKKNIEKLLKVVKVVKINIINLKSKKKV